MIKVFTKQNDKKEWDERRMLLIRACDLQWCTIFPTRAVAFIEICVYTRVAQCVLK